MTITSNNALFLAPPARRQDLQKSRRELLAESRAAARQFATALRGWKRSGGGRLGRLDKWAKVRDYLLANSPLPFACSNPVSVFGALDMHRVIDDVRDVAEFKAAAEEVTHPVYCQRKGSWWLLDNNNESRGVAKQ